VETRVTIPVYGMTCNHCVNAVTKALHGLQGVCSVQVSLEHSSAEVVYEEGSISADRMKQVIVEEGYSTDGSVKEEPREETRPQPPTKAATPPATFKVEGMTCANCAQKKD